MTEETLFEILWVLLAILAILWFFIGISLIYNRIRQKQLNAIELLFAEVSSRYLYPLRGEKSNLISIQRAFRRAGVKESNPRNVQYLIDLMIRAQRSILGENYKKLQTLYRQIPPFKASLNKLASRKWYVKARGIREIYEMGQEQYLREVLQEINHKNIYVRREAQIAMVVFLGWDSLRFLPYLKREMTLWQQIKIVEKLHDLYPEPDLTYLKKAYTAEQPYAQELIMRIIRKFNLLTELDYILKFLDHDSFDRREAAIYCLSTVPLDQEQLEVIKKKFFLVPNVEQQLQLLKSFSGHPVKRNIDFLNTILHDGDEILKLRAAEVLWNSGYQAKVEEYYYEQYKNQNLSPRSA